MKKFLFAAIAVMFCLGLSAQDIKKVRNFFDKKDWPKAKEYFRYPSFDKHLPNYKPNPIISIKTFNSGASKAI